MKLSYIMAEQARLLQAMGWPGGSPEVTQDVGAQMLQGNQEAAKGHLLAAMHECTEAMNELNWKPWKPKHFEVNKGLFTTELTDILQFVCNAALVMNISPHDLEKALEAKWEVNYKRIENKEVTHV